MDMPNGFNQNFRSLTFRCQIFVLSTVEKFFFYLCVRLRIHLDLNNTLFICQQFFYKIKPKILCDRHCRDYHTIKTISKIKKIQNSHVQRAHIAAHFGRHDEAEELFRAEDRTDLATEHKNILGDEVKVKIVFIACIK